MVSASPTIPISLIQERISGQLHYKVSYFKAWKAKQKAIARVFGDWEESYDLLPRWLDYMLRFSPGSHYELQTTDFKDQYGSVVPGFRKFGRVFWTYKQCCDAFDYCKPMIQIDGTFLYGKYSGTLLIATTQDGNSNVLPLAFAIVEGETLGAWTWFLRLMRVHVTRKQGICLISDRHASILSAVGNPSNGWQPPHAYHVYCIRHVASNFNTKFHNTKQKNELINMAYEPCPYLFEQRLAAFRGNNRAVRQWINEISNEKWSRACDVEGRRYGHMTTNLSEVVNKVFRGARNLPITSLVKSTYSRLVEYFVRRGSAAAAQQAAGDIYCNKVMEAMRKNAHIAQSHIVRTYSIDRSRFEIEEGFDQQNHRSGYTWRLNLDERTCECGRFQAFKYPCSHVIAACANQSLDYLQYIDDVYTIKNIVDAYSGQWYPIGNDLNMPPRSGDRIAPDPAKMRKKGRPRSTRIRNEMDLRETQPHPSRRSVSLQR